MMSAGDRTVIRRRDLEHYGTNVLGAEERHEVDGIGVWRQKLVLPVGRPRPVKDLVDGTLSVTDHRLRHQFEVDDGNAPDDRLDGPAMHRALSQFGCAER